MNVQPEEASADPAGFSAGGNVGGLEVINAPELPDTGEPRVDEALAALSGLASGTSAEATEALSLVLQKLEQVLGESQDSGVK